MWNANGDGVVISDLYTPYWQGVLFAAGRHPGLAPAPGKEPIYNTQGEDIRGVLEQVAAQYGLPLWFVLACAIAESGLNRYAERWNGLTPTAKKAILDQDWTTLQSVIDRSGEDISFSYGQQTLQLFVQRPYTVEEALQVRSYLFDDPARALADMAQRMQAQLHRAGTEGQPYLPKAGGDIYLAALLYYNSGVGWYEDWYWERYQANVANYRGAMRRAKEMVGD